MTESSPIAPDPSVDPVGATKVAPVRLRADISDQWSWAASAVRIPQIADLTVEATAPAEAVRLTADVRDADVTFGTTTLYEGQLDAGTTVLGNGHIPLSASVMSLIDERREAECVLELIDQSDGKVLARYSESLDIQPRDLWFWRGDPHLVERHDRLIRRGEEIRDLIDSGTESADSETLVAELTQIHDQMQRELRSTGVLGDSLLASFVRPNHPEIARIAREAADRLENATGDGSFFASQIPDAKQAAQRIEDSVTAIYESLRARAIQYSDPPPGWDYTTAGQRIRDHGDVARGGLGTCMDTTVLMAAVAEHVGLLPVLVLVPRHIFVGYWRHNPDQSGRGDGPDWYPQTPILRDTSRIRNLVEGGYLGLIETTAFSVANNKSAAEARGEARNSRFVSAVEDDDVRLIDVVAARRAGVSPLPAVNARPDGVTEVIEYQPGRPPQVTEVEPLEAEQHLTERAIDTHPARYRTWKSSLFSLNATNDLLNLKKNARVQPLVLPPEGLGVLEDELNRDISFRLLSTEDFSEIRRAQGVKFASDLEPTEILDTLRDRRVHIERPGTGANAGSVYGRSYFVKEVRAMARAAKVARDERGMNPLYLCIGLLRWQYRAGAFADAPIILVPVNITATRRGQEFLLSLDTTQNTTPNAALVEWLRREHDVIIPGLVEPPTDRAGLDVDAIITEVRNTIIGRSLDTPMQVVAEARLATLDLSAFRMWQDLNAHAEAFLERPLVRHLTHTPTATFVDPQIDPAADEPQSQRNSQLEQLETPIPADATQMLAVLWASQRRTFVLQGPPGTGKSQTITNMVAQCVLSGLRVLFVAEKGTALAVVQRRLESIGLGPFTLNLHHEGSNAAVVRTQLRTALTASVRPDPAAMDNARRRLRNAGYGLAQYPDQLHEKNAAGLSAYAAHDELLVLGEGPTLPIPAQLVAHHPEQIDTLSELFEGLQHWTAAAGVRPGHPWRLSGPGAADPLDVDAVNQSVRGVLAGLDWAGTTTGALREALDAVAGPAQLVVLASAANPLLEIGRELGDILDPSWVSRSTGEVSKAEAAVNDWTPALRGFHPDVLDLDLRAVATQVQAANASSMIGRKNRQVAAVSPLSPYAPNSTPIPPGDATNVLNALIPVKDAANQIRASLGRIPGIGHTVPSNLFRPGAFAAIRARLDQLIAATAELRDGGEWSRLAVALAQSGDLAGRAEKLGAFAGAWQSLCSYLVIQDEDLDAWRAGDTLAEATRRCEQVWRRDVEFERLVPLQRWCQLVRKLEPLRSAGLGEARTDILEGRVRADVAEEALARGVASASLTERISAAGLDRFDAVAHDERVTLYADAQRQLRAQWLTTGPAALLERRSAGGFDERTGGLARELEKTRNKLSTRAVLRRYGVAVQELTPLVVCSPSSAVDLIEPGTMEFDLVIFDEASQITVPEAVGALGRARAAIVVGDSKQMPPTRKIGGGASDEEVDDPDGEEIVEDQESILSECELARVPTLSLDWHYRSQDESLIAFSNRTYYRGHLSSFPTPTLLSDETGIEFRRIEGQYLRAGSPKVDLGKNVVAGGNTNPVEARAIVAAIHDLVHRTNNLPSVGIVTFNESQRQLIEDLLLASTDPRIAEVMDEQKMGRGEALFVKALEQVQGDERDVIIFSIAFSKQANGRIPTNFGPLTNAGGERRLNVAITRARRKNVVYCSFDPTELDVANSTYSGPKDLKEFLLFAKTSGSSNNDVDQSTRTPIRDRHRDDIAAALRAAGLHVLTDAGLSNFRLDLILARESDPGRPVLPILLDGESWRQRSTVSDRDVLPIEVLQNLMGWPTVARIWWPMWLQNRDDVISRVLEAFEAAEALLATQQPAPLAPAVVTDLAPHEVEQHRDVAPPHAALSAGVTVSEPDPPDVDSPISALAALARTDSQSPNSDRGRHASQEDGDPAVFIPAHADTAGTRDTLDALPDRAAAAAVREQLLDVISAEGPVEVSRLVRLVARRFGLAAVRAARADDITRVIPRGYVRKSRLGAFAWPTNLDPKTWQGFRVADPNATRALDEIAPEEIANAMRAVIADDPSVDGETLLRRTAEVFGVARLGANVRSRLQAIQRRVSTDA